MSAKPSGFSAAVAAARRAAAEKAWDSRGRRTVSASSASWLKRKALRLHNDMVASFTKLGIKAVPWPRGVTAAAAGASGFGAKHSLKTLGGTGSYGPLTQRTYGGSKPYPKRRRR